MGSTKLCSNKSNLKMETMINEKDQRENRHAAENKVRGRRIFSFKKGTTQGARLLGRPA